MSEAQPLVGVIMGSKSDWETMRQADEVLTEFDVPHECQVVSAHRTPAWMAEYASARVGPRPRGDHRRRRRRGAPAGHGRGADGAAGRSACRCRAPR